jgi:hypothetical protein
MALNDELEDEYKFSDGDISSFMDDFSQPKQDMGLSDDVDDDPYFGEETEEPLGASMPVDNGESLTLGGLMTMSQAREMSKGLVVGLDSMASGIMGSLNGGDKTPFVLDNEERSQLITSLALVLKHNNAQISPTWGLITTFATIYGGKTILLVQLRKERKKLEEMEERYKKLERENEKLRNGASSKTGDIIGD